MTYAQFSWPLTSEGSVTRDILYNGYLRGPVILTPIAERLAVDLSLPFFYDLGLSRLGFEHPTTAYGANALTHCATAAVILFRDFYSNGRPVVALATSFALVISLRLKYTFLQKQRSSILNVQTCQHHLAKQSLILFISSARHVVDRINYFKTRLRLYVVSIQSTTFKHENGKLRRKTQHQSPKLEETSLKHHYRKTLLSSIHLRQGSRLYSGS